MLLIQKLGRAFFTISGMLMLVAALLIWANPVMGDEALPAEVVSGVEADAQSAPCKGLKPYNNLDELLYQFYINLDSDCLFEMPLEELEKIWGVKILDAEQAKPHNYCRLSETEFGNKPYKSEKDSFYIELVKTYPISYHTSHDVKAGTSTGYVSGGIKTVDTTFIIRTTKEYYDKHGEVLPSEKLRELLPARDDYLERPHCQLPIFESAINEPFFYKADGNSCGYYYCYGLKALNKAYQTRLDVYPDRISINRRQTLSEIAAADGFTPAPKATMATKTAEWKNAPCRGLKSINGLEDLLYQFYINMDSNCISKMPLEELEKTWGTKIIPSLNDDAADRTNRPYTSEKYGFYIKREADEEGALALFTIWITDEYKEKYSTLIPDGHFPRLLPRPLIYNYSENMSSNMPSLNIDPPLSAPKKSSDYGHFPIFTYRWYNTDSSQKIQIYTHDRSVLAISLGSNKAPSFVINKTKE